MDRHREIERTAADWLARRSDPGRPWTDADRLALDAWLSASSAHQVAYIRLESIWRQADRLKALGAGLPAGKVPDRSGWRQSPFFAHRGAAGPAAAPSTPVRTRAAADAGAADPAALRLRRDRARPRRRGPRLAGAATGLLLAIALSVGGGYRYGGPAEAIDYRTALGDVREVPLPDGSLATLGSDTRLQAVLSRRARRIELAQGEAYFEVRPDVRRPFTVQVGQTRVTAVGTRFAVRADAGGTGSGTDRVVRVVVTEGTVRLDSGDGAPSPLLAAGAVATVRAGAVQVETGPVEQAERVLGWRTGEVAFSATPLAEAAAEFNRYNVRRIVIDDPGLAQVRVDGGFRIDNVEGFVRLLEAAFDVEAERTDDRIVLRRR